MILQGDLLMANYIIAAERITKTLETDIFEILGKDTVLHRYFELLSKCSQIYFEYVKNELDTTFELFEYKIMPRPYRFSDESRIKALSFNADRIFCIEQLSKKSSIFIAGCEKQRKSDDSLHNYCFAFNCDFYGEVGLKSFCMFYLTICEALSVLEKTNKSLLENIGYTSLRSWFRQHSSKISKQYFMAQDVSKYFRKFDVSTRFVDFELTTDKDQSWTLETIYPEGYPEGITIVADGYKFTALKEMIFTPMTGVGLGTMSNIYTSRTADVDTWRGPKSEDIAPILLRQPSIHEDSFKDMVDDVRRFILNEIQH